MITVLVNGANGRMGSEACKAINNDPSLELIGQIDYKDDLQKMNVLRRILAPMGTMDAIEFLNSKLKNTKNNADFFVSMNKPSK